LDAARSLHAALSAGAKHGGERGALLEAARACLDPLVRLEYLELIDSDSFEVLDFAEPSARLIIAAWVGEVRLIDNLMIGEA
jgi:pantothenate synthetase